jgi:methyl-accepting chemotaxis protein
MGGELLSAVAPASHSPLQVTQQPTRTAAQVAERVDALALAAGVRVTASALLIACVVVIMIGAQSLLGTMQDMDRDIKLMNEQMAIANGGLIVLNDTMDSLPKTARHLSAIVKTVDATAKEVSASADSIEALDASTASLNDSISEINASTTAMTSSLTEVAGGTGALQGTIDTLNTEITPLAKTQNAMLGETQRMRGGVAGMNASLGYTIRILNYITAPPTGQGLMIRADLPKETLPPLPGLTATTEPIPVFPRNAWPIYTGP